MATGAVAMFAWAIFRDSISDDVGVPEVVTAMGGMVFTPEGLSATPSTTGFLTL